MQHLAAVASSDSRSHEFNLHNALHVEARMTDTQISTSVVEHVENLGVGSTPSRLILEGALNRRTTEDNDQSEMVIELETQLHSLAKIPVSRLGKGATVMSSGYTTPSVLPPAFTVFLGGVPRNLANRLFTPANSRYFSQPDAAIPMSPQFAAVIAPPPAPSTSGSLFYPICDAIVEQEMETSQTDIVQNISNEPHGVVSGDGALDEVDESSAAVAGITTAEPTENTDRSVSFEEQEMDESVQISTSQM